MDMAATYLITGATGLVGGHLAEACVTRGPTRALVRPGADAGSLPSGVEVVPGDLTDSDSLRRAVSGVEVIFHCAAKVGDWGPVEDYRAVNVEGLRSLLDACREQHLTRFVHFSSLGVYAARHHYGTDETEPLPARHMDGYTQSKVEAEQLALRYQREHGVPVVVLRPGFIYGPRDRTMLPRVVENLREGVVRYLGSGEQALNTIYVGNLVEAAFLAAEKPGVVGQIYNLTDGEKVSKRRFFETVSDGFGIARPKHSLPLWMGQLVAWWLEGRARRRKKAHAPRLTQARIKFLGLNLDFSIEKARRELGYQPKWSFAEGMERTLAWYKKAGTLG
jgi:nucleoside-diphosphate-sugar epimerase